MKYCIALCLILALSVRSVHAQAEPQTPTPPAAVSEISLERVQEKSESTLASIKVFLSEAFLTTEAFRLKYAEYYTTMREEKKEKLRIDNVPSIDDNITTGIAGIDPEPRPQTQSGLQNPLEYGAYILSISLASLFSNQVIFYISSALLFLILVRFIISRLV